MTTYYLAMKPYRKSARFVDKVVAPNPNAFMKMLIRMPILSVGTVRAYDTNGNLIGEAYRDNDEPYKGLVFFESVNPAWRSGGYNKDGKIVIGLYGNRLESWRFTDGRKDGGSTGRSDLGHLTASQIVRTERKIATKVTPKLRKMSVTATKPIPGKPYSMKELADEDW